MIPTLLQIGPFPVHSFGLMLVLAFFTAWRTLYLNLAMVGGRVELAEKFIFWIALSGIVGARVWFLGTYYEQTLADPIGAIFSSSGFVFYGGFLCAFATFVFLVYREKQSFFTFADLSAPAMMLGYAVGRIGCHLSGDGDYGIATDVFWGFRYHLGVVPTPPGAFVHPTPVYESLFSVLAAGFLLYLLRKRPSPTAGVVFGWYLVLSAFSRFFVEFIRIEPRVAYGLTQAQIISIAIFTIGILVVIWRGRLNSRLKNSTVITGA